MINMINTYEKSHRGTIKHFEDGSEEIRSFMFEPKDVGKFIVIKWKYEEHMFCGGIFGTRLKIGNHILNPLSKDELYGVYEIGWCSEWCKNENNMSYKVKLTPVSDFAAWCPNRSWYSSDMASHINHIYNLFEENPLFDKLEDAIEFSMKKNDELYPDTRSEFKKFIDKIFNK